MARMLAGLLEASHLATFDDLAPLLAGHPALRQQVQRRFQPATRSTRSRLTNDLFRGPP